MKRRNFLSITSAVGAGTLLTPVHAFAEDKANKNDHRDSGDSDPQLENTNHRVYRDAYAKLRTHLLDLLERSKVLYDNNLKIHSPCVSSTYRGLWPDDFLYPLLVEPGLYDKSRLTQIARFLTDSMIDLNLFPDRVDSDGMPMMHPGYAFNQHPTEIMPIHLPAAWIRLLDNFEKMGATVTSKEDWAQLFKRGVDSISFACGLAYSDPQHPRVGFGFHDQVAVTGFELMSSMVLHFGLKRAARFFRGYIHESEISRWERLSKGIADNLYRLYDEEQGAYLAGSKDCRQVNVWGTGLAYWMSTPEIRKRIGRYYKRNYDTIFLKGATRQIAEADGWQRMWDAKYDMKSHQYEASPVGHYINGGFWSVGTGWILPVMAVENPELAVKIVGDMVESSIAMDFPENIKSDGTKSGASGFLAGIALPMMALKSIIEKKTFTDYF